MQFPFIYRWKNGRYRRFNPESRRLRDQSNTDPRI